MKVTRTKIVLLVVALGLILIDFFSKNIVTSHIAFQQRIQIIPNFFWLTHVKNTGAAWSILENSTQFLGLISLVAASVMFYIFIKKELSLWSQISLMLMFAGTVGNGIDRLFYGSVIDMFSFNLFGYMFPIFNVADSFLVIGVGLFALETLLMEKKHD